MTTRKNTLLIAVAAAALAVGSGTAFSQAPHQGGQKSESPSVQSNPASKNAPAEKIQGADQKRGGNKAETTGQGASERGQKMGQENKNGQKMGQESKTPNHKSTTGQAPSEPKSGQATERQNQKMGTERQNQKTGQELKNQEKSPNNKATTGQAPSQQTTPRSGANEQNRMNGGQTNERSGATENRSGTSSSTSSSTSGSVNLSSEQRTKIHSIIVGERSAPRVAHADFDVRVGTVVPRGKVKFAPLPSTIVEIEPSWRGYEYFLVGDEIVVVDPATLRIVAVVPA